MPNLISKWVVKEAEILTEEPVLPRRKKIPRRTIEESDCYNNETPKEYFRKRYFEVLDVVSNEISRRFDQKDFSLVAEIEQTILAARKLSYVMLFCIKTI